MFGHNVNDEYNTDENSGGARRSPRRGFIGRLGALFSAEDSRRHANDNNRVNNNSISLLSGVTSPMGDDGYTSALSFATVSDADGDRFEPARSFDTASYQDRRAQSLEGGTSNNNNVAAAAAAAAVQRTLLHPESSDYPSADVLAVAPRPSDDVEMDIEMKDVKGEAVPAQPLRFSFVSNHSMSSVALQGGRGFDLMVSQLSMRAPRRFLRPSPRSLLHHVSVVIPAGTLCAVLCTGPSPAHALLSVLAGVEQGTSAGGAAMGNQFPTADLAYRRHVAFIFSTAGCCAGATVQENILYSIGMRYGGITEAEEMSLVYYAAELACLLDCLDTYVDELSAAQRYQLAIAMEVVLEPSVVLLDDPMRYFDLASTQVFVNIVRNLMAVSSRRVQRTVVFSGNALPWPVYDMIDQLVLLSEGEGRLLYTGDKAHLEPFFHSGLGIPNIQGEAIADLLAQMEDSESTARMAVAFTNSANYSAVMAEIEAHQRRSADGSFPDMTQATAAVARTQCAPSYARQWVLLWRHSGQRSLLSLYSLGSWTSLLVVFLFTLSIANGYDDGQRAQLQNRCGAVFLLVSTAMQINTAFLKGDMGDYRLFIHQKNNRYFFVGQYFTVTVLRLLLPRLLFCLFGGLSSLLLFRSASSLVTTLVLGMSSVTHASLTLVAISWYPSLRFLYMAGYCYFFYSAVASGYLVSLTMFPSVVGMFSLLRYGYGGIMAVELKAVLAECNSSISNSTSVKCEMTETYLIAAGLQNDSATKSLVVLFVLSVLMLAVLGTSLRFASNIRSEFFSRT